MTLEAAGSHADVQRLCRLAGLPRATYYRHLAGRGHDEEGCGDKPDKGLSHGDQLIAGVISLRCDRVEGAGQCGT